MLFTQPWHKACRALISSHNATHTSYWLTIPQQSSSPSQRRGAPGHYCALTWEERRVWSDVPDSCSPICPRGVADTGQTGYRHTCEGRRTVLRRRVAPDTPEEGVREHFLTPLLELPHSFHTAGSRPAALSFDDRRAQVPSDLVSLNFLLTVKQLKYI